MWATADESREEIVGCTSGRGPTRRTIDALPARRSGEVPWWPSERNPVTLHQVAVHLIAELHRHAGHADIVREQIDGAVGMLPIADNLPAVDADWWPSYVERVETAARAAALGPDHTEPRGVVADRGWPRQGTVCGRRSSSRAGR